MLARAAEHTSEHDRALTPQPEINGGFQELTRYVLELEPGSEASLYIDDEQLPLIPGEAGRWTWEPGFYAGEVTAELRSAEDRTLGYYLLDVSPDPTKLGRDVFQRMIEEIRGYDATLLPGLEPAQTAMGELGPQADPWIELARLRRYDIEFHRTLRAIQASPLRTLRAEREHVPLHRARRVDQITVRAMTRTPAAVPYLRPEETVYRPSRAPLLDVPRVDTTLDSAANRCLAALTQALLRRTIQLRDRLEGIVARERSSETRTQLAQRWPLRRQFLDDLERKLRAGLRTAPLQNVRCAEISAAGLNAISAAPLYARAWRIGWKALRHGFAGPVTDERMWISPTWEIYERWCFVELARTIQGIRPDLEWSAPTGERFRARSVRMGRSPTVRIELRLQALARGGAQARHSGLRSISMQRIPDVVLTIHEPSGKRFFVFDAKYRRVRSAVLDAMSSAHIYQDSLRLDGQRPEATFLLVPAASEAKWLEDSAFHARERVGIHVLAPGLPSTLPDLLSWALQST